MRCLLLVSTLIALAMTSLVSAIDGDLILESRPQPADGLVGQRIVLAQSHGYMWNDSSNWWGWQRTAVHGEREDLITPRITNRWLVQYFQNAGATVVTTRERDEQTHEIRIDDSQAGADFEMSGVWDSLNVSDAWQGGARTTTTVASGSAQSAVWYADFPKTDRYGLCIWVPEVTGATTDARYTIHTAGGDVSLRLNQTRNTARWFFIDWFVFPEGRHQVITLTADSDDVGATVVADGIRLGGGMGDDDWGGGVSGLPRWQEFSKGYARLYGAPASVWDRILTRASDAGIRRDFAEWLGGDFMFEFHTNATNGGAGTQSGTLTIGLKARNLEEANGLTWMHSHIVQSIRDRWEPTWVDQGMGSISVSSGYPYPSELIELAYHDRLEPDLLALVDPDFRSLSARAIYEGIARIVAGEDVVFVPDPPEAPAAVNLGGGQVRVSWQPPSWGPAVTNYRIQTSDDAFSYGLSQDVGLVTQFDLSGYAPSDEVYIQIIAENSGGRSFPTETVGVRVGDGSPFLVVNGFDRLDQQIQEPNNPRRFVRDHIGALSAARPGRPIDSCANETVASGAIALGGYDLVDWYLGRESTDDETLNATEQGFVASYLDGGGRLLLTGTDIGFDLVDQGSAADESFASDALHLDWASRPSVPVRTAIGQTGTSFGGLSLSLSNGLNGLYDISIADVLAPGLGGEVVLAWTGGGAAGIAFDGGPGKALTLATPLEAVVGDDDRNDLATRAVDFLLSAPNPDTVAPQFTNLEVANIGPEVATIRWTTDEPATAEVEWGTSTAYGESMSAGSEFVLQDMVNLTSLIPITEYHVRVTVSDYIGNTRVSQDLLFDTVPFDSLPPVFNDVQVIAISDRDAIIHWRTDEPATTRVEWGDSDSYGNFTVEDEDFTIDHWHLVSGLSPSSLYHWRPVSRDIAGNVGEGADQTMMTLAPVGDVIVDNTDPGFLIDVGSWSTGSFSTDKYGSDYRFATVGGSPSQVTWTATLGTAGVWQAHCYYPEGGNRTAEAHYMVLHSSGLEDVLVNQQANGGQFNSIGAEHFYAAPLGRIRVDDTAPGTSDVVMADAVMWRFVGIGTADDWRPPPSSGFMILGE